MTERLHRPFRPLWLCRICVSPWPCGHARRELLTVYAGHRLALGFHLATLMIEADRQLTALHPDTAPPFTVLYGRFMGWLPRWSVAS